MVAKALAKSRRSMATQFESFDRERKQAPVATGSGMKLPEVEGQKPSAVESIKKISSELETEVKGTASPPLNPSLADTATEAEIAKLIDSKDWGGLGEYSAQEEVVNERALQSIDARSVDQESEEVVLARLRAQRELEAAMVEFGSTGNAKESSGEESKKDDVGSP